MAGYLCLCTCKVVHFNSEMTPNRCAIVNTSKYLDVRPFRLSANLLLTANKRT